MIPTRPEIVNARKGDQNVIMVFMPAVWVMIMGMIMPRRTPMIPPPPDGSTVSTRNCVMMSRRRAKRARHVAASEFRRPLDSPRLDDSVLPITRLTAAMGNRDDKNKVTLDCVENGVGKNTR